MIDPVDFDPYAMPAIRRLLRSTPDFIDFGILPNGSQFGQADFAAMFASLAACNEKAVYIPPGNYAIGEGITINQGLRFIGDTPSRTVLSCYHTGIFFRMTGLTELGGGFEHLSIVNATNANATMYIQIVANADGTGADYVNLDTLNLTCSGTGTIQYGIQAAGNARTGQQANKLQGVRDLRISNCDIFNATWWNIDLQNACGVFLSGIKCYQAGGTVQRIQITGANAQTASWNIQMVGCAPGDVQIDFANRIVGAGNDILSCNISQNANTIRLGTVFGDVWNQGVNSIVTT